MIAQDPVCGISVREFDAVVSDSPGITFDDRLHSVPIPVYEWLERQCLRSSDEGSHGWARPVLRQGRRAVQFTGHVGVLRGPGNFCIEILPKISKRGAESITESRKLLIEMLSSLGGLRHLLVANASIAAARMPLLEVFLMEFLQAVNKVVKRGIASQYRHQQDNLSALRGKLLIASQIQHNACRKDRFYAEHDVFSADRAENRLLRSALDVALKWCRSAQTERAARELIFAFNDLLPSRDPKSDFQHVRLDRSMDHYAAALAWARLILEERSPVTGRGEHESASLLFPMPALFESFVAQHLASAISPSLALKSQVQSRYLVQHKDEHWFRMKPDLLLKEGERNVLLLDTKWKLLDGMKGNSVDKYKLSQADIYQLFAYGHNYLGGNGDIALVYPKTDEFSVPLPAFEFPLATGLKLWVLPFCLKQRRLCVPQHPKFEKWFNYDEACNES